MSTKISARPTLVEKTLPASVAVKQKYFLVTACIGIAILCLLVLRHLLPHASSWPQGWFNPFDSAITRSVNRFANRWLWLNPILRAMEEHNMLKGGPVVLLFWVAFFERRGIAAETLERRRKIAATVPLALFAVILARVLALALPFRERPLRTVALHFQLPHTLRPTVLYGWSSFPSDHAALFIALAVGLFMASRFLGTIAFAYTVVAILLPRVYLGLHWPTDLIAGAAIGAALASLVAVESYRDFIWKLAMKSWQNFPGISAAFVFFLSYEIIELFQAPLAIAKALLEHHL